MTSEIYKRRAEDCLRLAQECPEPFVREALHELAEDFLQEAKELAAEVCEPR
jgi:hypothetical protein